MELKNIKKINQTIYELDSEINRNNKMIFISTIIFCLINKEFRNPSKISTLINFSSIENPIDQMIAFANNEIKNLNLQNKTFESVKTSLNLISGINTKLDKNREKLRNFIVEFVTEIYPNLSIENSLFLEEMYMEVDKKAKNKDKGITLTPYFASILMVDLAELDYRNDTVADLASGTGIFSILSYLKMKKDLDSDFDKNKINLEQYNEYYNRLQNSVVANDSDVKMITLTLANFVLKDLNCRLIFNESIFDLDKSSFSNTIFKLKPTVVIMNPPYEDEYKPIEMVKKSIELIKNENEKNRLILIIPPQKFSQNKDIFFKILNLSSLKNVIKMQDDLFSDSGSTPSTCILTFSTEKEHDKNSAIRYYNFTDSGFVYLKDSGIVDKNKTHTNKRNELLISLKSEIKKELDDRNFSNFYDVINPKLITNNLDPNKVKLNKDEADISYENALIKRMLSEKNKILKEKNNEYVDTDGILEDYLLKILEED
jgi:predicted RNA methylase